jgi:GGDEF domain-containing protein
LAFDREEYQDFHANLTKLGASLLTAQDQDELIRIALAICEAVGQYNREAQRVHGAQTVELRCMIEMLSQTLISLAQAGGQSVDTLQSIQKQLEVARQLNDIRLLRARLGDSLKTISDEAKRQRERNDRILQLAQQAALAAEADREDTEMDRVTGLPSSEKAEREIADRSESDATAYVAVFVVERVEGVNLRFGHAAGDQLLKGFGQFLVAKLSSTDKIFRWRGPSFAALLSRPETLEIVRNEVARFATECRERPLEVNGKTIKLPIGCRWTVLKLSEYPVAAEACQQIDRFVAGPEK